MSLPAGSRLGPYEIVAKVGEGGMGDVYRARDTRLDRTVAVKIVRADFGERFEREAKSISALNHPNICTLHDVGHEGGTAYLVLEFVEGAPIAGPVAVADVIRLGIQICDALHAAHQKGIVHRDLKPANILNTKAGIKLLDFGLAKLQQPSVSQVSEQATVAALTGAHTVVGTPQYMAPEQIEGRDADARTDIFALGCVLYELVTGKRAFEGKSPSSVMAAILATEPRKPSELVPVTPPMLEWIILRCLEKDPDARWQSARDIGTQLRWVGDHIDDVRQPVAAKRSRVPIFIGIAAGIALGAIGWLLPRNAAPPSADSTGPVAFTIKLPDKVALVDPFSRPAISLSPDGLSIAFAGVSPEAGQSAIYLRRFDQLDAVKVAGSEGAENPFFSPDSRWIGFTTRGRIRKVPIGGGVPVDIVDVPTGVRGCVWLADDTIVYSGTATGLMQVSARGGAAPVPLTKLDLSKSDKTHRSLVALPGGKAIVFVIGSNEIGSYDEGRIVALELATGTITDLAKGYAPVYSPSGHLLYIRDATTFAVPFDAVTLQVSGSEVQVLKDVAALPNYGSATVTVSGAGVLAYAQGGNRTDVSTIVSVDRDGTMATWPAESRAYADVRVSPDGKRVCVMRSGANNSLWVFDMGGSQPTRLTSRHDVEFFAWSPDGSRITYWGGVDLRSIAANGSGDDQVLVSVADAGGRNLQPVQWSDDGKTLVVNLGAGGKSRDIATYSGGKLKAVVESRFEEWGLDLSPDGRWLLYSSDENQAGKTMLFVRDLLGDGKWPVPGSENSEWAQWAKGGRELLFVGAGLQAMPFTPGPPPVFGPAERLGRRAKPSDFDFASYPSATRDGSRFVITVRKALPPVTEIRVVTNWSRSLAGYWK